MISSLEYKAALSDVSFATSLALATLQPCALLSLPPPSWPPSLHQSTAFKPKHALSTQTAPSLVPLVVHDSVRTHTVTTGIVTKLYVSPGMGFALERSIVVVGERFVC